MATYKVRYLRLGPGDLQDTVGDCQIWTEVTDPNPTDGKNGDIWIVAGNNAKIYQKSNGLWVLLSTSITEVPLNDGQVAPATILTYNANLFPMAKINYVLRRGIDNTRQRSGNLTILADANSNTFTTHDEIVEFGSDVNVTFSITMTGGIVSLKYTSATEGVELSIKYSISGF